MNIFKLFGRKGFHVFTAVTIITGANGFAESGGKVWQKYVNFRQANNDLSTWTGSAKTTDLFPGIPVGVAYDISTNPPMDDERWENSQYWIWVCNLRLQKGENFLFLFRF